MNKAVTEWVDEMARLVSADRVRWLDGSDEEYQHLIAVALRSGELIELDRSRLPGCYLHRTAQNDVARVEHLTYICTHRREDAGPTNNWMPPETAYEQVGAIARGSMRGHTMYVIPYLMGVPGSPFSRVGVQITDSIYVALNMRIMTRIGSVALSALGESPDFVKGLHSRAGLDPNRRYICHFPEDGAIWSVGSGYGGNALLGKKCMSLRIASHLGRQEGWLAEHMLIVGIEDPQGHVTYVAGAFPSACGKTNLAMMIPPREFEGYRVWTLGDDIAWLRIGPDGRLWAVNPEFGFFGVAPGTSRKTNPNAMVTVERDTIYTNVVLKPDGTVWWEGADEPAPPHGFDWKGRPWSPGGEKGAHPNSRFTAPARNCPSISPMWEDPRGVPVSAFIFGGRRARVAPLVYEAFDWQHGVYVGSSMASETTTAATGRVGVVRRDPMAMLPFCGYNMGDYFAHWLSLEERVPHLPRVFHVNWFRTDENGDYIWPGFGQNFRVIKWIVDRCQGRGDATESPVGLIPTTGAIDLSGLDVTDSTVSQLLEIDRDAWLDDVADQKRFFASFDRMPSVLVDQRTELERRLSAVRVG